MIFKVIIIVKFSVRYIFFFFLKPCCICVFFVLSSRLDPSVTLFLSCVSVGAALESWFYDM